MGDLKKDKIIGGRHYTKQNGEWHLVDGYFLKPISGERQVLVEHFECEDLIWLT